ncbi:MAG: Hsp20/alpha crystallin family protein [Deltaproteobacteria bacterium]|nr:Hsp20/alpha crystallin family protein [Deltaproteobacteria bacterium]
MAITRWNPFNELQSFTRAMESMFEPFAHEGRENLLATTHARSADWPRVDIYEDKDEIVLRAELPGMERKDVELLIEDRTLTIRGERKLEHEDKREHYLRLEGTYGVFNRYFTLPTSIDSEKIRAEMHNGVMHVHVPKRETAKGRPITIHG